MRRAAPSRAMTMLPSECTQRSVVGLERVLHVQEAGDLARLVPESADVPDLVHADDVGFDALDDARDAAVGEPAVDALAVVDVVGEKAHGGLPVRGWAPQDDARSALSERDLPRYSSAGTTSSSRQRDEPGLAETVEERQVEPGALERALVDRGGDLAERVDLLGGQADLAPCVLERARAHAQHESAIFELLDRGLEERAIARRAVDEDAADLGQVAGLGGMRRTCGRPRGLGGRWRAS